MSACNEQQSPAAAADPRIQPYGAVNGQSVKSCTMLAVQADGATITTVEGLTPESGFHPIQAAFREKHGLQCGFCTPGMMMAAVGVIEQNPGASEEEIRDALEGNLCRCTGYQNIVAAVKSAADQMARS